jgi:diacylglycerol kinase (ATP)
MKSATIFHNPKAGEGDLDKKKLMSLVEKAGYDCSYISTKKVGWDEVEPAENELIVLAGGDGTVRKVAGNLLDRSSTIGLIPLGTANNIAKTLGIGGAAESIIQSWKVNNKKKFDVGRIYGLKQTAFFLEGLGYGAFPKLMKRMNVIEHRLSNKAEKNLKLALEELHDIILNMRSRQCRISVDGSDHSGKFILVEVMNTQSIGPNLNLASFADPGDGTFEVILISERQREEFASYVHNKLHGIDQPPIFNILKAKNLEIYWEGELMHVDDEVIELKEAKDVKIKIQEGVLEFLVPQADDSQEKKK